jgi:hypothetical protein
MSNPTNMQSPRAAQAAQRPIIPARLAALGVRWVDVIFCAVMLLTCANYFAGVSSVPFHPDEATQIFMSSDLDLLFTHPGELLWSANPIDELRQHYRELDAPLTRYLIGSGRAVENLGELPSDWDWTKSWSANQQQGALPSAALLLVARLAVAWLFPISLILVYLGCRQAGHAWAGLIACALLGFNPLVLLHTRRAMAESVLLFGCALLIWTLSSARLRPWITGVVGAIALNAKQSALGLIPAALIGVVWLPGVKGIRPAIMLVRAVEALGCLALITFLLNPFVWQNPISTISAATITRQDLLSRQTADYQGQFPAGGPSLSTQVLVVLGQIYLAPLQFEEAGNYTVNTASQKQAYLQNPLNDLLQGPLWGAGFLFLTVSGMGFSFYRFRSKAPANRRWLILLTIATLGEFLAIVIALPLPFQRYVIPLIPLACIWSGIGIESILRGFTPRKNER